MGDMAYVYYLKRPRSPLIFFVSRFGGGFEMIRTEGKDAGDLLELMDIFARQVHLCRRRWDTKDNHPSLSVDTSPLCVIFRGHSSARDNFHLSLLISYLSGKLVAISLQTASMLVRGRRTYGIIWYVHLPPVIVIADTHFLQTDEADLENEKPSLGSVVADGLSDDCSFVQLLMILWQVRLQ